MSFFHFCDGDPYPSDDANVTRGFVLQQSLGGDASNYFGLFDGDAKPSSAATLPSRNVPPEAPFGSLAMTSLPIALGTSGLEEMATTVMRVLKKFANEMPKNGYFLVGASCFDDMTIEDDEPWSTTFEVSMAELGLMGSCVVKANLFQCGHDGLTLELRRHAGEPFIFGHVYRRLSSELRERLEEELRLTTKQGDPYLYLHSSKDCAFGALAALSETNPYPSLASSKESVEAALENMAPLEDMLRSGQESLECEALALLLTLANLAAAATAAWLVQQDEGFVQKLIALTAKHYPLRQPRNCNDHWRPAALAQAQHV